MVVTLSSPDIGVFKVHDPTCGLALKSVTQEYH